MWILVWSEKCLSLSVILQYRHAPAAGLYTPGFLKLLWFLCQYVYVRAHVCVCVCVCVCVSVFAPEGINNQ